MLWCQHGQCAWGRTSISSYSELGGEDANRSCSLIGRTRDPRDSDSICSKIIFAAAWPYRAISRRTRDLFGILHLWRQGLPDFVDGRNMAEENGPRSAEDGHIPYRYPLIPPHRSSLPTLLYLFSFAELLPSALRSPRAFFAHPHVLYAIGMLNAVYAGACTASIDILYGYWSQNTDHSQPPVIIRTFANKLGWIATCLLYTSPSPRDRG